MGDRHPGEGGHGERRRDAGDDLVGNAGGLEGQGLLASPAEHVGIAALQPHHRLAGPGALDEQGVDRLLGRLGVLADPLADVDQLRRRAARGRGPRGRPAGRGRRPRAPARSLGRRGRSGAPGRPGPPRRGRRSPLRLRRPARRLAGKRPEEERAPVPGEEPIGRARRRPSPGPRRRGAPEEPVPVRAGHEALDEDRPPGPARRWRGRPTGASQPPPRRARKARSASERPMRRPRRRSRPGAPS